MDSEGGYTQTGVEINRRSDASQTKELQQSINPHEHESPYREKVRNCNLHPEEKKKLS